MLWDEGQPGHEVPGAAYYASCYEVCPPPDHTQDISDDIRAGLFEHTLRGSRRELEPGPGDLRRPKFVVLWMLGQAELIDLIVYKQSGLRDFPREVGGKKHKAKERCGNDRLRVS